MFNGSYFQIINSGVPPGSGSFIPGAILVERRIYAVPCLAHVYFDFCHGDDIQQAVYETYHFKIKRWDEGESTGRDDWKRGHWRVR